MSGVETKSSIGLVDFDLSFYDPLDIDKKEVREHVLTYMGEKLLMPRMDTLWIGFDKQLDPDYLVMMQRSINHSESVGRQDVAERYRQELVGMQNLVELVTKVGGESEMPPVVIMASDPGEVYVDEQGVKKSKTFIAMLHESQENGWYYRIFDLPTKYIGLEEHWEIVESMGDIQRTEELLKQTITEITANNLIAFPAIFDELEHSLDELAYKLGYTDWEEVEEMANNQLELEGDKYALERREEMVEEFTRRIMIAVRDDVNEELKISLVNAMADTFALEQGGEYLYREKEFVLEEIEKIVGVALADTMGVFDATTAWSYEQQEYMLDVDLGALWQQREWMVGVFRNNPLAQEARATGCGGAGISLGGQGVESWFGVSYQGQQEMSYSGFELIQNGYQETTTESYTDNEGGLVKWENGKPVGTKKEDHHVGCPLCKSCDVTAYYTATHICCGNCHGAVRL